MRHEVHYEDLHETIDGVPILSSLQVVDEPPCEFDFDDELQLTAYTLHIHMGPLYAPATNSIDDHAIRQHCLDSLLETVSQLEKCLDGYEADDEANRCLSHLLDRALGLFEPEPDGLQLGRYVLDKEQYENCYHSLLRMAERLQ